MAECPKKPSKGINIYLLDEMAFVDINNGYMLCIGSRVEVDEATPQRLVEMIQEAIVTSQWRSIDTSVGHTAH